jgi:hypothetical protein
LQHVSLAMKVRSEGTVTSSVMCQLH